MPMPRSQNWIFILSFFFHINIKLSLSSTQIPPDWRWEVGLHACLEQHPTETKVLRWDFHNFGLHYIHTYQNSWIWNQNQREFWENANFSFQILKYCLILKVFDTFSLCNLKTKHFLCLVWKRRVGERYQLMTLGTKILEFGPFWAKLWLFSWQN